MSIHEKRKTLQKAQVGDGNLMVGGKDITDNNFEMQNVVIYFESNNSWSHNYEIT